MKNGQKSLRKGRVSLPNNAYLITTTASSREKIFSDDFLAICASQCFENRKILKDAHMLAWVLMPDHVHWLIQLGDSDNLSVLVGKLKAASSRSVNQKRQCTTPVWDKGFHDHAIRDNHQLLVVARYIVANPLRAGLVNHVGDYPYWNSIWL